MSNQISLTIPNDDPIALRAFGNALEEMAVAHGAEVQKPIISQKHAIGDGATDDTAAIQTALDNGVEGEFVPFTDDDDRDAETLTPAQKIKREMERQGIVPAQPSFPASDLDADGLPWDARIHSSNQERNSDNTWRVRRRPKDLTPEQWAEQVAQVREELFALMAIPVADPVVDDEQPEPTTDDESPAEVFGAPEPVEVPAVTVEVPPVAVELPPAPPIVDPVPPVPPVVAADPVPPAPAPLPTVTNGVPATLAELMTWLTSKAPSDDAGRAARLEQINGIVARHGLVTLGQLQKRLDLIPQVYADLVKELGQ